MCTAGTFLGQSFQVEESCCWSSGDWSEENEAIFSKKYLKSEIIFSPSSAHLAKNVCKFFFKNVGRCFKSNYPGNH